MRLIETDTSSNANISSATEVGSYTADAARRMAVRLFADQVAGNGDYTVYMTIQRGGAGSAYRVLPITTATAASGVTAIAFTTIPIDLSSGDIMKVYIDGLAGDTTTPDVICEFWEDAALRPTTAGQHNVDVTSGGEVGIDWANIGSPTSTVNLSGTTVGTVSAFAAAAIQSIWDRATSALTTVGSIGKLLVDNVNATIGSRSSHSPSDVWAVGTRTITGGTISTNSDKTGYSLSAGGIQSIWDALTSVLTAAGSIGKLLVDNIDATISSRGTADPGDAMDLITNAVDSDAMAASAITEIAAGITVDCSEISVTLGQTPGQVAELIKGDLLTIYTDSKFSARLYVTGGINTDRDDFLLTLKSRQQRDDKAADSQALLQWSEDSGLLYINEKTAADAGVASSDGTLTISNSTVGDVTTGIVDLTLTAQAAALLQKNADLVWDGKEIHPNPDNSLLKIEGTAQIKNAVTRTIT